MHSENESNMEHGKQQTQAGTSKARRQTPACHQKTGQHRHMGRRSIGAAMLSAGTGETVGAAMREPLMYREDMKADSSLHTSMSSRLVSTVTGASAQNALLGCAQALGKLLEHTWQRRERVSTGLRHK